MARARKAKLRPGRTAIDRAGDGFRADPFEMERILWSQTGAAYAASLASANTDDLLQPIATRGPDITFTDEELEDF